jgi:hypothetical protein
MKKIFTVLGILFSITLFAQNGSEVINALKDGNASKFSSYFANNVDVKLPQKDELKNIDKAEAASAVKTFFDDNNINGFEVTSQREMGGTMYIAGKLKSGSQSFNITVMLKNKGDDMNVITVRIS